VSTTVELAAHAKVNLLLRVLAREVDGYHSLETLFCRISLADTLRVERVEGGSVALEVAGADTGPAERNLAVRAAEMVLEATGRKFGVRLTLTKRIPVRAGLGGGSSDGAASLLAVNQLAADAVPRHELLQFAAKLGSDVPFFISGGGLALAWGRGERMLRLPPLPQAQGILLIPKVGVSTAEAYRWVDVAHHDAGRRGAIAMDHDSLSSWGSIGRLAGNDFESAVFSHHPEIRQAFEALAKTYPLACRMSGSGSALFAVYKTDGMRDDAVMMLGKKFGDVVAVAVGGG
jgi:4-diphosphocytidyl-2-C-methyl-D-erythritol kinase